MASQHHYLGILLAISSAVLMATIGVFSKLTGMGAEAITFFRLFLGAFFMFIFLFAKGNISVLYQRPSLYVCFNGLFLAGFIIFYVQAMQYTSMANAIMLIYLAPLLAAVFAHFFMQERLTVSSVLLILLAILGFAMMLEFKIALHEEPQRIVGIALGLLASICYCGFILINRKIIQNVYTATFYQLLIGSLAVLPLLLLNVHAITGKQAVLLLGVGFFPGFLGIFFAVAALRRLPAATFGTLAYFEPLAVVLFGWFIFSERLNFLQICGCFLILLSGASKAMEESFRKNESSIQL